MADQRKNIVILENEIVMGGINIVLMNILKNLDPLKYDITFLVETHDPDEEAFLPLVPDNITPKYLQPKVLLEKARYYKRIKKNIFHKIIYNYLLWQIRITTRIQFVKYLDEIRKEKGEIDVFIDFGHSPRRYVNKGIVKKSIVWRHALFPINMESKEKNKYLRYWSNFDKVVAVSNGLCNVILEAAPNLSKLCVAYNPVDLERIGKLSNSDHELRKIEKEYLSNDYIITVTRLDLLDKDYETLLKAYKIAHERGFSWKLYIVGDGSDREKVVELIEKTGLTDDVILIGLQKNPYVYMRNAKFLVLSSILEGFGLVLVEAMTLGAPVISTDCPEGPREILQDGKSGILVPVGDAKAMADKFMELYNNPDLREKYAKIGKERAQDFSIANTMKVIEQIINE